MTTFNFNGQASCVIHQVNDTKQEYQFAKVTPHGAVDAYDMIKVNLAGIRSSLLLLDSYAEREGHGSIQSLAYFLMNNIDITVDAIEELARHYEELESKHSS